MSSPPFVKKQHLLVCSCRTAFSTLQLSLQCNLQWFLRLIRTVGFSAFSCSLSSYCSTCYPSRSWFDWCPARRGRACKRVSVWALLHGLVEVSLFSVQCVRFWQWIVVLRCKHNLAWFCLLFSIRKHEFQNKEYGQTELYSSQMKFATREFWEAILTHRVFLHSKYLMTAIV